MVSEGTLGPQAVSFAIYVDRLLTQNDNVWGKGFSVADAYLFVVRKVG
jgi:hypothetical protein